MVTTTAEFLGPSRDSTPTPSEHAALRFPKKDFSKDLTTNQGVYASHLEEIRRSLNSPVPSVSSKDFVSTELPAWLTPGDAKPNKDQSLNMPDTRQHPSSHQGSGRPSGSTSRGDSRSRSNLARRFPGRPPVQNPNFQSSVLSPSSPDAPATSSTSQHQPFPSLPQYQSPAPYTQAGGYVGHYPTSNPPHMGMISAPYTYVHPHSFSPQDMSQNTHVSYSAPPIASVMQSPLYQYQGQQTHEVSPNASSHSFSSAGSTPLYTHMNSSPPPHPVPGGPPHSAPYSNVTAYSPIRYSAPSHYPFPSQSYSPGGMYQSAYAQPSYPQHYGTEQDGQSAWWYIPCGPHSTQFDNMQAQYHQGQYQMRFPPMANSEMNHYGQAGRSSGLYSESPHQNQPRFSSPQVERELQDKSPPLPPPIAPSTSPSSSTGLRSDLNIPSGSRERQNPVRRAYHPNPPMQRSEWVMWAGNVPSDATHDELLRFFSQASKPGTSSSNETSGGVSSIFLISRSNCAFVNFDTEEHLQAAISRFSGQQMRPGDPKCPHLVCRVRKKDDDLKAGVGGQRGVGLHSKWVRHHKGKIAAEDREGRFPLSKPLSPANVGGSSASSDEEGNTSPRHDSGYSNSSGSYASTNSSLLVQYFPKRYFILKSLTQFDLDLSVERGVWATQRHNEGILDQAFRTSTDVYLIFGVNKSGEFYGYARMSGPISRTETKVPWATRIGSPASLRSSQNNLILSPGEKRFAENSPAPVSPETVPMRPIRLRQDTISAPAELHQLHSKFSLSMPGQMGSLDRIVPARVPQDFRLDRNAPIRALRNPPTSPSASVEDMKSPDVIPESGLGPLVEEDERQLRDVVEKKEKEDDGAIWGEPFKIEWVRTGRLPFYRTRHLRNPWNNDREIKVSRDGTELEPGVGQALLDEWDRPEPSPSSPTSSRPGGGPRRETKESVTTPERDKREGKTGGPKGKS